MEVGSMKIVKKRCEICHKWFLPDPRTYRTQRCCSNSECRKKRKAKTDKNWRDNNPGYDKSRKEKKRKWAKAYPDYWQKYRKEHPDYVKKDNKRRSNRYKKEKISANQVMIREKSVEKLKSIQKIKPYSSANQVVIHRRVEGILEYLIWKESSANQVNMDNQV